MLIRIDRLSCGGVTPVCLLVCLLVFGCREQAVMRSDADVPTVTRPTKVDSTQKSKAPPSMTEKPADLIKIVDEDMTSFWLGKLDQFPSERTKTAIDLLVREKECRKIAKLADKYDIYLSMAIRDWTKASDNKPFPGVKKNFKRKVQALEILSGWVRAQGVGCHE